MSVQRVDPSEWTLAACGAFFRVENTIVLEARSILYAVQYVESNYPLGRFLTFSDNPALLLALCKGRPNTFTLLSVMRRIFVSGFATGFVLSFRLIPSIIPTREVVSLTVIMTRANHFFMIWHSAQTQSSPAQTCDRDCLSPSLTHLDAGTADLATHVRVAAVSHVPSDDLSNYTGHAAAVSSQRSSVNGKNNCISSLTSQGSFAPMTFCGLPLGLVESQFLDESQMQWSSADIDTEPCHARSPTEIFEKMPTLLDFLPLLLTPSARRE